MCKNQKISLHFSRVSSPPLHREAEKEMERKFLVLLRRFSLRKEQSYFNIFVCSFLHPHGDRGAPISAFGGNSSVRSHFASTSHWPFAFAHDACSVFASCSLCGFVRVCGNSRKQFALSASKSICACPAHPMRAQKPVCYADGSLLVIT